MPKAMEPTYYGRPRMRWGHSGWVCEEVDPDVIPMSYTWFMDAFLPGPGLSPEQKERLRESNFLRTNYSSEYEDNFIEPEPQDLEEEVEEQEDSAKDEKDSDNIDNRVHPNFAWYSVEYPELVREHLSRIACLLRH